MLCPFLSQSLSVSDTPLDSWPAPSLCSCQINLGSETFSRQYPPLCPFSCHHRLCHCPPVEPLSSGAEPLQLWPPDLNDPPVSCLLWTSDLPKGQSCFTPHPESHGFQDLSTYDYSIPPSLEAVQDRAGKRCGSLSHVVTPAPSRRSPEQADRTPHEP